MTARRLAVVTAGLAVPSSTRLLADRLAAATEDALSEAGFAVSSEVVELRPLAHDLADNLLTGFPNRNLQAAVDAVLGADGLIAVSPIFRGSYSGLFKSFFDVLEPDTMAGKPVLVAATGGTARHSLALDFALRPLFSYLRAVVVPTGVFAASEDWAGDRSGGTLAERVARAGAELGALVAARPAPEPVDAFADPVPFEQLLSGG